MEIKINTKIDISDTNLALPPDFGEKIERRVNEDKRKLVAYAENLINEYNNSDEAEIHERVSEIMQKIRNARKNKGDDKSDYERAMSIL